MKRELDNEIRNQVLNLFGKNVQIINKYGDEIEEGIINDANIYAFCVNGLSGEASVLFRHISHIDGSRIHLTIAC